MKLQSCCDSSCMRGLRCRAARRRGRPGGVGPTLVTERKLPCSVDHRPDISQPVRVLRGISSHWRLVSADTDTTSDPPTRNNGKPHSASSEAGPNRRETIPSKVSRVSLWLARSSTGTCSTATRAVRPAATTARAAMSQRRSLASTRVQRDTGSSKARSTPTRPAPAPQSTNSPPGMSRQVSRMNPAEWRRSASRDERPMAPAARAGSHASSRRLRSSGSTWARGRGAGNAGNASASRAAL